MQLENRQAYLYGKLKLNVMKTLKFLLLMLLSTGAVLAQPSPDNMFISGTALDFNGQAIANLEVCVYYNSNSPVLPSDTVCVTTNANGYYYVEIVNGSVSGPNVEYMVIAYPPNCFAPVVYTVDNGQGTVDVATVDFVGCGQGQGNCDVSITSSNDSINGTWTFVANPTGTAPFTYDWWVDGAVYSTQTVSHMFNGGTVGVSVTVTDANGCESTDMDTLFLNGNQACDVDVVFDQNPILGGGFLTANANGSAPFTYLWNTGETSETIFPSEPYSGTYCVTITDASGCQSDACYTFAPNQGCSVDITTIVDSTGGGLVYTLTASGGFAQYTWSNNQAGQSITLQQINPNGDVYCVTATDQSGCTATACDTLLPNQGGGCNADFWYQTDANGNLVVGDTVEVLFTGLQAIQNTYTWAVEFGGQTWTSTSQDLILPVPPTLVPIGGLNVEVCVTVTDATTGCTDTHCETITLVQPNSNACSVSIMSVQDPNNPFLFELTANATGVAPFTYDWDNGSTTQTTPYVLNGIAIYGACVTVTDATGCVATACDTLISDTTGNNTCNADFSWMESNLLGSPLPAVEFTDQSSGAVYWYWDFGDNTFSQDQNPLHTYSSAGTYMVCLTIVNADQSCQETYCDTVVVGNPNNGSCNAGFSNSGPTPIGYTFSANVQDQNLYYFWEIDGAYVGDGFEAYSPGFTNGVHTICLTITDSLAGCSDTECLTITVGSPNCYGYISGQLYAGSNNQPLDEGVVYLITFDANTGQLAAVDSAVVDSGNYYFFGPLACGDYMVKSAAYPGSQYYSNHIPTYYGNSPFWAFAQTISISQPNTQITADVTLIAANNPGGPGFIGGDVNEGANKMDEGDPIGGMQVNLFDLSGNAIGYTYTDANGEFGFSNLAYGTYQVYVEALGIQTIPAVVTIGPDNPSMEEVHILASESLITTGIEEFDFEGAISDVYPNPTSDVVAINFNLEAEVMVNISIVDLAGRTVSTQVISVASGENTIRIEAERLNEGYYFLNIQDVDGAFSVTRKFMRVD